MWCGTWRVKGYSLCGVVHGELRDTVCVVWCGTEHGELRDTVCVVWYRTWRVKGYSLCGVVQNMES